MKAYKVKTKCIVAKTDKLLSDFICNFVKEKDLELVGRAENGIDAIKLLLETKPDLLIVGDELSGISGLDLAAWIKHNKLQTKTIIFSRNKSSILVDGYKDQKINGLLFSDDGLDEFSCCLDFVLQGKSFMSKQAGEILKKSAAKCEIFNNGKHRNLTAAEIKILWHLASHMTIKQIAESLSVSPYTINNHMANVRQKLKLSGHHSLAKYALSIRHKLMEVEGTVCFKQDI